MKKRAMSIVLAAALVLQMLPLPMGCLAGVFGTFSISEAASMSGTLEGNANISWKLTTQGSGYKLTLSGTGKMPDYTRESYKKNPTDTYNSYRTTAPWKESAEQILAISVGSGITNISNYAFYNCVLTESVEIPASVESIGSNAFDSCAALTKITLPNKLKTIDSYAFRYCTDLENITIPESVTSLGGYAFQSCSSLKEITVPASIKNVPRYAFAGCKQMTKAVISEGVESIGENAFGPYSASCESLKELVLPKNSLKTIGDYAFNSSGLTSFTVPASVTSIGANPFVSVALPSITVEQGNQNYTVKNGLLIEIKDSALYRVVCHPHKGSTDVTVPDPVEVIGQSAFQSTPVQNVDLPGSLLTIGVSAFSGAASLEAIEVPGQVQEIQASAFYNCRGLQNVKLGGDLLYLRDGAFQYCTGISELILPDKLTTIGNSVFSNCSKLKELSFPNSITTIGGSVLANCTSLEEVSFGQALKNVLGNVFLNCPKLATITVSPRNDNIIAENNVLYDKDKTRLIYYASGMEEDKFKIPDTVEIIGSYGFTYCTHLTEIRFPASVTSLEYRAVYYNASIKNLLFYGNAPEVTETYSCNADTNDAQKYCNVYNTSIVDNSVKNGYYDNTGVMVYKTAESTGWENGWEDTKVYVTNHKQKHSQYKWVQKYMVDTWNPENRDVASGKFDNGLEWSYRDDIGEVTFSGKGKVPDFTEDHLFTWSNNDDVDHMQDIKSVDTGDASEIGDYAFYGAKGLRRILTETTLERVGERAFADCTALEVVRMQNVATIDKEAFMGDTALKDELDVRGAKVMGDGVFKGCTGMTDILLGAGLKTLGKEVFASCSALETMMLPESVLSFGEGCFNGCSTLRTINIPKEITDVPASCFAGCENLQKVYFYGDYPNAWAADSFDGTHVDVTIYYRADNSTWSAAGNNWNGIPVVGLDKFYTEQEDHYSFANTGSSFGYGSKYFIPRQRYVTAVQSIIKGSYYYAWDSSWKGSCFGMAASTTEFYEGDQFDVKDYTATAENLYDVLAPRNSNADLTKLIEIYQVSQYADEISRNVAENYGKYRKLIKQVEEFERSGGLGIDSTADPVVMCVYSACGGHAVVPVSVNVDSEGNYALEVYDCNYPNGFRTLKIKKDFSGISYDRYSTASFVKYSTIRDALEDADFTGESLKKPSAEENTNVLIAVNREDVSLVNSGGRDYSEIEGAYEQRTMSDGEEEFSGIRSFVLPQDQVEYQIKDDTKAKAGSEEEEDLKYYVATEDLFSEIETSDKDAELTVRSVKGTGRDSVSLTSKDADTESEITVMDTLGVKKEISVQGSSVQVEIANETEMKITVSDDAEEVKVDGEELKLTGNQAKVSFFSGENQNPMEAADLSCELSVDEDNQISGLAEAYVTWSREASDNVDVITKVKDETGKVLAEYKEKKTLSAGMQKVNIVLDKVKAELDSMAGEFNAVCEMTLVDSRNNEASVSLSGIVLKGAEQQAPEETETPSASPSASATTKPQGTVTIPSYVPPIIITPTPVPTQKPDPTEAPVETVAPSPTPDMEQPPQTTQQPDPTEEPDIVKKSSVPKKGKVLTAGSVKYIVVKSAKKNGTVAVYGAKKKNAQKVVIPKTVKLKGYSFKVTGIHQNAFSNMSKLSEVKIGANVTTIGKNAFKNCKKLKFIVIPAKVTTIGSQSFAGCTNLNHMLVKSDKIKSVGAGAFKGITSKATIKTSKGKWRQYANMFMNKGKMSHNALFIIDPVKLKYKGRLY